MTKNICLRSAVWSELIKFLFVKFLSFSFVFHVPLLTPGLTL